MGIPSHCECSDCNDLREAYREAKKMAEHYSDMTRLEEPSNWRCSKEGGPPEIGDYAEEDIGDVARSWLEKYGNP